MKRVSALVLTLVLLAVLPCLALAESRTVTVTATVTVQTDPDTATIQFGVVTSARDVAQASAANAAQMDGLIRALAAAGIPEEDVHTSSYYVNTRYNYQKPDEDGNYPIIGYEVSNTLSVTVRNVDQAGSIIDLALASGATSCNGISFSSSGAGEASDQALTAALAEGHRKAALIAASCGGSLGELQHVTEVYTSGNVVLSAKRSAMDAAAEPEEAAFGTYINGDSVTFSATVEMTFELLP